MRDRLESSLRRASAHASDRWLIAWALGYGAVGAASLLVPLYALTLGGGPLVVGALEATAGLAGVPGALLWGRLADRTGQRRGFVIVSLLGTAGTLAVVPFVESLRVLLVANGVLWFLVAAASPVLTLFMIERAPTREWEARIGLLNAYQRYGWVGGLLAGTAWLGVVAGRTTPAFAQRSFFVVCALAAFVAAPLAVYLLPPTATVSPDRLARSSRSVQRLLTGGGRYVKLVPFVPARALVVLRPGSIAASATRFSPTLRRYFLTVLTFSAAFAVFFGPAPAYLADLGYSAAAVFGFFIVASLASAVAFVPVGRSAGAGDAKSLQLRALAGRVVVFPAIGLVGLAAGSGPRTVGLGVGFGLIGLTWAVVAVTGAGLVTRSAPPDLRGEALGVYAALAGLGGGVGGLLGGLLAAYVGYLTAFGAAGGLVLVSVGLLASTAFPSGGVGDEPIDHP